MEIYTFTSNSITNIWAGIGAGLWAVSQDQSNNIPSLDQKAAKMLVGSVGIIYCSAIQSFTTPFLVYGAAQPGLVTDVWPETWALPFAIKPLGTPHKLLHKDKAQQVLPVLQNNTKRWDFVFHIQGSTVFVPTTISPVDWKMLLEHLAA